MRLKSCLTLEEGRQHSAQPNWILSKMGKRRLDQKVAADKRAIKVDHQWTTLGVVVYNLIHCLTHSHIVIKWREGQRAERDDLENVLSHLIADGFEKINL